MDPVYLQIAFIFTGMIMNVLIQLGCFRLFPGFGLLKSAYLGFITGIIILILCAGSVFFAGSAKITELLSFFIVNLIIYLSFSFFYFTFLNLGETGRRIRILRDLYDARKGLSEEEILSRYGAKEIIVKRIARLENHGQIVFRNNRYFIGRPIMLLFARVMVLMKIITLGRKSEFETKPKIENI